MRQFCINCTRAQRNFRVIVNGSERYVRMPEKLRCHFGKEMRMVKFDDTCAHWKAIPGEEPKRHDIPINVRK